MEACVLGPSGLLAHNPGLRVTQGTDGVKVRWSNGAEARIFGAGTVDDVERLRAGGNRHVAWLEEVAAWRQLDACFEHMEYGLRLGPRPHWVGSTTPKPRPKIKALVADETVTVTHAKTTDNPHLAKAVRDRLMRRYSGTRLGRQELLAELLEDIEGALWSLRLIDQHRTTAPPEHGGIQPLAPVDLIRVVVAIDPAASNTEDSDETGIVAAGLGTDGRGYVLDDRSGRYSPGEWARVALRLAREVMADVILGEINNGGDMVAHTIHVEEPRANVKTIRASRGKAVRAEPVSALYERGLVAHVGTFPDLEDQMASFVPSEVGRSLDDRVDALVYALTELLIDDDETFVVVYDPTEEDGFGISPL